MDAVLTGTYVCAKCLQVNEIPVDPSAGFDQSFVEDCAVCCWPNLLRVLINDATGEVSIEAVEES